MLQNLSIEKIKIFENEFKQFMGIKDFPAYQLTTKEVSLAIADSCGFDSAASTFYSPKTNIHTLQISTNLILSKYLVFHEFTHILEFNGNIYLSAYAVPRTDDRGASSGYELEEVVRYLFDNNIWEISSEELTPMVRDKYTALLLVCDPKTGKPNEFYSVKGSLGGELSVSDTGNLLWDVESITSTFFSPATSSFTIGGTSYVFRYAFDTSGLLISQEKTDEVVNFRR